MTSTSGATAPFVIRYAVWAAPLAGVVAWAYWPTLVEMAGRWSHDPQYSHGYLVPLFALALLWARRKHFANEAPAPSVWGVALLIGALAVRLAGTYFYYSWLDP